MKMRNQKVSRIAADDVLFDAASLSERADLLSGSKGSAIDGPSN